MTDRESKIQQNVDKTLASFDQCQRVTPDPWFYHRVITKIQSDTGPRPRPWPLFGLHLLKPALLIVMVILNIGFIVKAYQLNRQQVHADYVSRLVSDYGYASMEDMFKMTE